MKEGGGPQVKWDSHLLEIGKIADRTLTEEQAALGCDSHQLLIAKKSLVLYVQGAGVWTDLICTGLYRKEIVTFLCDVERLKYAQNKIMKCKVDKVQEMHVARLKRVGHV